MVNATRVKRKLPSLLVNGSTTNKRHWAERRRVEYGLSRLRKCKPRLYRTLEARLMRDLEALEAAALEN